MAWAELPKEIPFEGTSCHVFDRTIISQGDSRVIFNIEGQGVRWSDQPDFPFGRMSVQCVGSGSAIGDQREASGYCDAIDADGDRYVTKYGGGQGKGTWSVVTGTGKFAGMTGEGSNTVIYFPRTALSPGTVQFCNDEEGTFRLP